MTQRIDVGAGKARIQAAGGDAVPALQCLAELTAVDSEVRLDDVVDRQSGKAMQLIGDRTLLRGAQFRTRRQCPAVVPHGEALDRGQEAVEITLLSRQLVVIPGGRAVGRQGDLVREVDARVVGGRIGAQVEVQDLRQQDDTIEIDAALRLELVDEHRGAACVP